MIGPDELDAALAATRDEQDGEPVTTSAPEQTGTDCDARETVEPWRRFFYGGRSGYAFKTRGRFLPLPNETQVRQHLLGLGYRKEQAPGLLCAIRQENFVCYIGPVAGWPAGIHENPDAGEKMAVTTGPRIVEPGPGASPFINAIVRGLFADTSAPAQLPAALGWLAMARQNLIARRRRPLPALGLVGPVNCGKTLFAEIARQALGGRAAHGYRALAGLSNFNGDLAGAELIVCDDETASKDSRTRVAFAHGLKGWFFGGSVRVEAKHRDAVILRPIQGCIICANDEPEAIQTLPLLDRSMADKITLCHVGRADLGEIADDRDAIAARIAAELPAFLRQLEAYRIPEAMRHDRTGIRAFQHPRILEMLRCIAPEQRLADLLEQCQPLREKIAMLGPWRGPASELEAFLNSCEATRRGADRLLNWHGAAGALLGRLADRPGSSIGRAGILHGSQQWEIRSLACLGGADSEHSPAAGGWVGAISDKAAEQAAPLG